FFNLLLSFSAIFSQKTALTRIKITIEVWIKVSAPFSANAQQFFCSCLELPIRRFLHLLRPNIPSCNHTKASGVAAVASRVFPICPSRLPYIFWPGGPPEDRAIYAWHRSSSPSNRTAKESAPL